MENRHGLVVDACVVPATGTGERDAAVEPGREPAARGAVTIGGDKGYDTRGFVATLRALERHAAHRAEDEESHARSADDAPSGLRHQSTRARNASKKSSAG